MNIICPHCGFSKSADPVKIPGGQVKVKCPKCSQTFSFNKAATSPPSAPPPQASCPACGLVQTQDDRCIGCGVIYEKFRDRQQQRAEEDKPEIGADSERQGAAVVPTSAAQREKAGFWIRVVASLLDSFLMATVQFILSLLIGLVVGILGFAAEGDPAINMVIWLFGVSLSICYAVFFTGYCGQTPGKMALRIKVIRTDGSPISYGRAALREVPGKFLSSILLGVGYLMVAFDRNKQGLHDKIADTYVIKL